MVHDHDKNRSIVFAGQETARTTSLLFDMLGDGEESMDTNIVVGMNAPILVP